MWNKNKNTFLRWASTDFVCVCVCVNEWHGNRIITVNCYIERNGNGRQNWCKRPNAKQQQWQGRGNLYTRMFICVCVLCAMRKNGSKTKCDLFEFRNIPFLVIVQGYRFGIKFWIIWQRFGIKGAHSAERVIGQDVHFVVVANKVTLLLLLLLLLVLLMHSCCCFFYVYFTIFALFNNMAHAHTLTPTRNWLLYFFSILFSLPFHTLAVCFALSQKYASVLGSTCMHLHSAWKALSLFHFHMFLDHWLFYIIKK